MRTKKPKRGRPPLPRAQKQSYRAICHLDCNDKDYLAAAARIRGQSESRLLRGGLVAIGVLGESWHELPKT